MSIARIKKNDTVIAISGEYAGQTGKVKRVDTRKGVVIVEGLNLVKKAVRRSQLHPDGGFVTLEAPLQLSKVMPYDPEAKKGVRIRRVRNGDKLERVSKATNKVLD
jgi:large subunit ribosomal protein L24